MKLENNLDYINDPLITKRIIEKYKNNPSIKAIRDTFPVKKKFKTEETKVEQINKILRNINSRKATGPDKIPPKIVKMSANIIDFHLQPQFVQFSKGKEKGLRSKITGQLAF